MAQDAARVSREFDRIALLSEGRPNEDPYQQWLLRHVPRPCENALDVGCGTGCLTQALAERASRVQGIDLSPGMIGAARRRCIDHPNVEFAVADFLSTEFPSNHFDCIAAVAVIHHMPWTRAVDRANELLRPGGRLLIIDLFEDDGFVDCLVSGVACLLRSVRRLRVGQPRELLEAWAEHGKGDSYLTLSETRQLCRRALPGARMRRHLFWRYSIVWTKAA
jgi:ubiquinone/menaquinone biosynthesis C-methylase UbiE